MEKFIYKEKLTSQKLNQMVDEIEGKYEKPSDGIPKTDLNSTVQASLNKADSALQNHQDISHLATKQEVKEIKDNNPFSVVDGQVCITFNEE